MNSLSVVALTFAMMALGVAVFVYIRLDNLEQKLVALGVVPQEFSLRQPGKEPPR